MKKYFLLAILAGASVFVSAQTFKLSGHVRSGISTAFDGAKGEDNDDINSFSAATWTKGDYFGDDEFSRIRLDGEFFGTEKKFGASIRYQYADSFDKIAFSDKQKEYETAETERFR